MNRRMVLFLLTASLLAGIVSASMIPPKPPAEGASNSSAFSGQTLPPLELNGPNGRGGGLRLVAGDVSRNLQHLKSRDSTGKEISFATDNRKFSLTVVSFFATCCCSLCGQELSELKTLQGMLPELRIVLVSLDTIVDPDVKRFVAESGLKAPIVHDNDGAIYDAFGTEQVPQTFVLDHRGKILFEARRYGEGLRVPSWQSAKSLAVLRKGERGSSLKLPHPVRD